MMARIGIVMFGAFILSAIILLSAQDSIKRISTNWLSSVSLNNDVVQNNMENKCGPIALKMIFDYYKISSTLPEIEAKVGLSKKGTCMLALKEMAELKGLHVEGWRLTLRDFLKTRLPAILFVNGDHYVVGDSVVNDTLFLRDPTLGKLMFPIKKLPQMWKGETLVFKNSN